MKKLLLLLSILCLGMSGPPQTTSTIVNKTTTTTVKTTTTTLGSCITPATTSISVVQEYGLGTVETKYKANNRNYEWYIDQGNTGKYSNDNCGPSSVTMSMKWQNVLFDKTAEDARATYRTDGGWWYTDDMVNYLKLYNVPSYVTDQIEDKDLKLILDNGSIMIICIDYSKVRYNSKEEQHVDRFNQGGTGHFIVLKGYRIVDSFLFYEVYDPASMNRTYDDDTEKGKDRYYRAVDIWTAMKTWWTYAIIVDSGVTKKEVVRSVDVTKIPHAPGQ